MTTLAPVVNATEKDWAHISYDHCEEEGGALVGPDCAHPRPVPDVFFFSVLVFLLTFVLSYSLKFFRNMRFFPTKIRCLISDFAVMIAICVAVGVDLAIGLDTPKLNVPEDFKPTRSDRGWIINPFKNPIWTLPAAIAPALLATILIFMDQQITAVIVNRKEHKLRKGSGYHLDLFLIAIQIAICSLLGIPYFVAATVLSINHVRSLTVESESAAPGEKPKFLGIREQRVTGTLVFLMVGLSVFMTGLLNHIPMPVLYGVFLYMGVSSLNGVQLIQRISIMLMPSKYQPSYIFLRHVPLRRVHLFTCVQILCLALLWIVKTIKSISIIFPLMVLAMCFVRKGLDWVFTRHELKWLDDIMPEVHKREKEDKKLALEEEFNAEQKSPPGQMIEMTGGAVNIPLQGGQSIKVPVDRIIYDPHSNEVNISDEMGKTAIWKQLVANEPNPQVSKDTTGGKVRNRKSKKDRDPEDVEVAVGRSDPVRFTIAEEDTDALMPQIVVDPPSHTNTPDDGSILKDPNA
jgi:anion exchange protein